MLRAIKPEIVKPSKPKFMISGRSGVGKSHFALSFPRPFFIDTEGGANREQYMEKLVASGGGYMGKEQGSQDFNTVVEQVRDLATTKHEFKTLIIDSFSKLYNVKRAEAEESIGSEYARDKKEANKPTRQLIRWIEKLDMNVLLICHAIDRWSRQGKEVVFAGTTFDGFDKLEYDLDLWIEIQMVGSDRSYVVKKSRVTAFPLGREFLLDYDKFCDLYGRDIIQAEAKPVTLASTDQINLIKELLDLLKIDSDEVEKWLAKGGAESWDEMSSEATEKCITFCKKKIEIAQGAK